MTAPRSSIDAWQRVEEMLFAGNSLAKAQRVFECFHQQTSEGEADDPATNLGLAGVAPVATAARKALGVLGHAELQDVDIGFPYRLTVQRG